MLTSDFLRTGGGVWAEAGVLRAQAGDDDELDLGNTINTSQPVRNALAGRSAGVGQASVSDAHSAGVSQLVSLTNTPLGSRQRVPYATTTAGHIGLAYTNGFPAGADATTYHFFGTSMDPIAYTFDDDDDDATPNFLHIQALTAAFGAVSAGGSGFVNQIETSVVEASVAIDGITVFSIGAVDTNVSDPNGNWEITVTTSDGTSTPAGGSGFSHFEYDAVQILDGQVVTITTHLAQGYSAQSGETSGNAQFNLASTSNVWVFVRDTPAPIQNGDVDMDGDVDQDDFNLISAGFPTGSLNNWGDVDSDSDVDGDDITQIVDGFPPGTSNAWADSYKQFPPPSLLEGDADHDGDVDRDDFAGWHSNAPSNILLVSEDSDIVDSNYTFEHLSLREALAIADDGDTILFAPWVEEITLGGQLTIADDVTLVGPGADALTIDGNSAGRVFEVNSSTDAMLSGMTITGGQVTGTANHGGAIYSSGNLTIDSVVVTGNNSAWHGGAVYNVGGKLRIVDSTFSSNTATYSGGAVYSNSNLVDALVIERSAFFDNQGNSAGAIYLDGSDGETGTGTIANSTFSGNRALLSGGIIQNSSGSPPTTILNSTIAYNTAGGGGINMHNNSDNRFTLHNTILAHNTLSNGTAYNLNRHVNSASSYNIIGYGGGSSGLTDGVAGNDLLGSGISAGLAPLGDYGGKTKTHALLSASPALDKASNDFALASDQRGFDREYDLDSVTDGGDGYRDIGAYEAGIETMLTVRSDGDRNDSLTSQATIDSLRLREALALSAALAGTETIVFDQSGWADGEIQLSSTWGQLSITGGDVNVSGPGADRLAIAAAPSSRVFEITSDQVTLQGMRITGGNVSGDGGGIYADGDTTINAVQVDGNVASGKGGAIYAVGNIDLTLKNSTLWNNDAGSQGGGLYIGSFVNATVLNTTISGNESSSQGGGIYGSSLATIRVINATIAFNEAATGGGGVYTGASGNTRLDNTIVSDNSTTSGGADISGTFNSSSTRNLIGVDATTGNGIDNADLNNNKVGAYAGLMPLGYYGGPTKTHALYLDSEAIDMGDNGIAVAFDLDFDQRGLDRRIYWGLDDAVDIGAVELAIGELYY